MARKQAKEKATAPRRPEVPGRLIKDWDGEEIHDESVAIAMTDAVLRKVADEMKDVSAQVEAAAVEVREAKEKMRPLEQRRRQLVEAIAHGTLSEDCDVFKFADDEAGTVTLYDAKTHEALQTREMQYYERQEEAFAEGGDEAEPAADEDES